MVNKTAKDVTAMFTVKNVGNVDGDEIPQLYLCFPSSAHEPPKQLKSFEKVFLKSGESQQVTFTLEPRAMSIWNSKVHNWEKVSGQFTVHIGASSADIRMSQNITV